MTCCSCQGLQGCVPVVASRASWSAASRKRRARASRCRATASASFSPRPERISISDLISSPATDSESTGSLWAAERSSSKRWASERVTGSRIPNSSSIPTVKSVEASKTSLTLGISTTGTTSGQIEVQRVEEVNGGTRGVHGHLRRYLEEGLRVVEDDLHSGRHEIVGHLLGGLGGDREHAHYHVLLADHPLEIFVRTDREVVAHRLADLAWVLVEYGDHAEAVVGEDVGARDGLA